MWKFTTLLLLTLLILLHCAIADKNFFTAAVVEFASETNESLTTDEKLQSNLNDYLNFIKSTNNVDIILFPEGTLIPTIQVQFFDNYATEIPDPYTKILCVSNNDSNKYKEYLKLFSCASIENNMTIVINILEKENCTLTNATGFCPQSGIIYYNTDVVFDEQGYVSARYRKWNLFGESGRSPPEKVNIVNNITIKTNDTFGIFTCFDILFKKPSLVLLESGVKNILFPTMWFSELPYLTALQTQQMWSHENDVNFLSACANDPIMGSGGTGIYLNSHAPLTLDILPNFGRKMYVKDVPRYGYENVAKMSLNDNLITTDDLAIDLDNFTLLIDSSLNDHSSVILNVNRTDIDKNVCNGNDVKICCNFKLNIRYNEDLNKTKRYVYHLTAFNGVRSFRGMRNGAIELCSVIACLDESLTSCGKRFPNYTEVDWPITFQNLSISAVFEKTEDRIQFPNSLLSTLRPIPPNQVEWIKEEEEDIVRRTFSLKQPQKKILTFSIFGRDFARDD